MGIMVRQVTEEKYSVQICNVYHVHLEREKDACISLYMRAYIYIYIIFPFKPTCEETFLDQNVHMRFVRDGP